MKTKRIISRKDHEIYFIPRPEDLKPHNTKRHVFDTLSELHPVFSSKCQVDIKSFLFNKKRWFMASVISADVLSDYKLMYRGASFFTNTSILAHEKDFIKSNPVKVDDELIGFDSEKNIPVSIPLENTVLNNEQSLSCKLSNIPSRCSVFRESKTKWFNAAIIACLAVLVMFIFASAYLNTGIAKPVDIITKYFEEKSEEIIYFPSAVSILAGISEIILSENGVIENWQLNENAFQYITIQCSNVSASAAYKLFSELDYLVLQDIQNVNYIDGKPQLTVILNKKQDYFSLPVSLVITNNKFIDEFAELTSLLKNLNIEIFSEILPSVINNSLYYSISFSANEKNIVSSMEVLDDFCEKYSFNIKRLDVSAETDKKTFPVTCTLSSVDLQNGRFKILDSKNEFIPLAFGYKPVEAKRKIFITEEKRKNPEEEYEIISEPVETINMIKIIGSITDADGMKIYFHDNEGKITIRNKQ
ncbi:MAG: hypothetical protein FWC03_04150 [Treponema sp.]|nr:hypothetical protein [Treponema sp.]